MQVIHETVDTDRQLEAMATRLGYAGLIPFAAGAFLVWARPPFLSPGFISDMVFWTLIYGAVILSFMGGATWGSALRTGRYGRMVPAVIWALIGWAAMVPSGMLAGFAPDASARFLILFFAFTGLAVSELLAQEWGGWYTRLRIKLSVGTLLLLLLTMLGLSYS